MKLNHIHATARLSQHSDITRVEASRLSKLASILWIAAVRYAVFGACLGRFAIDPSLAHVIHICDVSSLSWFS